VPNRGLNNENMLSLVKGKKNVSFLNDLMEGSALIHDLHTAFLRSVKSKLSACYVTSFFETKDTQTVVVDSVSLKCSKGLSLLTHCTEHSGWGIEAIWHTNPFGFSGVCNVVYTG
jgi:hypothetical protein